MPEGIDIYSRFQTVTDWKKVRAADVTWCYQKVSDGKSTRTVQTPRLGSAAGVLQGGYHFSQVGSPVDQANLLVNLCESLGLIDLNPCLDMEDNPSGSASPNIPVSQKADFIIAFGRQVMSRGHGFTLYANHSDWTLFGPKVLSALPQTFRWVARYGANPTVGWDAHQYTDAGACPGISTGSLDRNRGKVPVNRKVASDMPLDVNDTQSREAIQKWVWYWDIGGGATAASALFAARNQSSALVQSIQKLTDLVIADSANDLTEDSLATALEGFFTTKVGLIIHDVLAEQDFTVEVDKAAIAQEVLNKLYGRLEQ